MNFSLLGSGAGTFFSQYWPVLVILVALIALYVVSMVRRKKDMNQARQMLDELKPGTKVKTYTGFYGTIDSIRETTDGKVVMLKIGEDGGKVGYIEIDANAIYGVDSKTDVVYDSNGNIIVKEDKNVKNKSKSEEKPAKKAKQEKKFEESKTLSSDKKEEKKSEKKPIKVKKSKTEKEEK